jgi:hypothetical protein
MAAKIEPIIIKLKIQVFWVVMTCLMVTTYQLTRCNSPEDSAFCNTAVRTSNFAKSKENEIFENN